MLTLYRAARTALHLLLIDTYSTSDDTRLWDRQTEIAYTAYLNEIALEASLVAAANLSAVTLDPNTLD